MFGIHYIKADPTQYIFHYHNGRLAHAGVGLAFFYYRPASSIVVVPLGSADAPFIFNEVTADYQAVTVQGQITYRIADPKHAAELLNYTISGAVDHYISEDPTKLSQRLIHLAQVLVRAEMGDLSLRKALLAADTLSQAVRARLAEDPAVAALGVSVLNFSVLAIRPTPEIAKALEAESREALLRQSDQAIYDRRNAAVEQERRIKENELNTEIAVEQKKRQIRETKADADLAVEGKQQQLRATQLQGEIALEEERKSLAAAQAANARTLADAEAYHLDATLKPLHKLDKNVLELLAVQAGDPQKMLSLAFRELAANAGKIGQLTLTPDLLSDLMRQK